MLLRFLKTPSPTGVAQMTSASPTWVDWKLIVLCYVCQAYAVVLTTSLPVICVALVYLWPAVDPVSFGFTCTFALTVVVNLSGNWFHFKSCCLQMVFTEAGRVDNGDSGPTQMCTQCNAYANRETKHCLICRRCVWRRDHHCFFLGRCVGYFNLKYFTAFCFHGFVGCAYALLILAEYLRLDYKEFWSLDFKFYIIPFASVKWMVGQVSSYHLFLVIVINTVFITSVSTLGMFSLHMYLIYTWRTSYEFWCTRSSAQKSLGNFRRVFGERWPLMFLWPVSSCGRKLTDDVQLSSLKLM